MERRRVFVFLLFSCLAVGWISALLVAHGNPGNMGVCGACFTRDVAGALGLHAAKPVQYIRPELVGIILGAFLAALMSREFAGRGGSAPLVRFILGMLMAVGALVFLGCPIRMLMRLGGGDLNGLTGLAGFVAGVLVTIPFHKMGYTLGASEKGPASFGWIMPILALVLLALAVFRPVVNEAAGGPVFASATGPGSMRAPLWISLVAGAVVGWLFQRSRFCVVSAARDPLLSREWIMTAGAVAVVVAAGAGNALLADNFRLGFDQQPIAHTDHLWNFLAMTMVGVAASLAGGCPVRQMVLAGEGNGGAGVTFLGMLVGSALAHNFLMVSSPAGPTEMGKWTVGVGLALCATIAVAFRRPRI